MRVGDRVEVPTTHGRQTGRVTKIGTDEIGVKLATGAEWRGDPRNAKVLKCRECRQPENSHKMDCSRRSLTAEERKADMLVPPPPVRRVQSWPRPVEEGETGEELCFLQLHSLAPLLASDPGPWDVQLGHTWYPMVSVEASNSGTNFIYLQDGTPVRSTFVEHFQLKLRRRTGGVVTPADSEP